MNMHTMNPGLHMPAFMPASASSIFGLYASFSTAAVLVRSMWNEVIRNIPKPVREYIYTMFCRIFNFRSSTHITMTIDQYTDNGTVNEAYEAAAFYLQTKINAQSISLRLTKTPREAKPTFSIDKDQQTTDIFDNITLKWSYWCDDKQLSRKKDGTFGSKTCYFLTFPSLHKEKVMESYIPHVFAQANAIKQEQKAIKIFSRSMPSRYSGYDPPQWGSTNLEHPSTFETLAMEPELKKTILEDLERFLRRKEYYKKVGKAWKRGYLMYGPPGTGKSSLIAAMANYLKFDIYDLELAGVATDADLKKILLSTTNRSILVIEDIDCSVHVQKRDKEGGENSNSDSDSDSDAVVPRNTSPKTKFTLSGLLNFTDGLWSSCGDERIVVFTTNHKERLDPALLRPGRMDMHIHMSYCTPTAFKVLASNYHSIGDENRPLCDEIQGLIASTEVTPAEVAEELMRSDDVNVALEGVANLIKRRKVENNERKEAEEKRRERRRRRKEKKGNADENEQLEELKKEVKKLKAEKTSLMRGPGFSLPGRYY